MADFDFSRLRTLLFHLPTTSATDLSAQDFRSYIPSQDGLEVAGTVSGALNFDLERILGHKVDGLNLKGSGPGLAALSNVLELYIAQDPLDEVLPLWGPALMLAAEAAYVASGEQPPDPAAHFGLVSPLGSTSPSPSDRFSPSPEPEYIEIVDSPVPPAGSVPGSSWSDLRFPASKKRKTTKGAIPKSSVPPWIDVDEPPAGSGRPADPLLRQLAVLCRDSRAKGPAKKLRLRCCGSSRGCTMSWVWPRNKSRICKHVSACYFVESSLRRQASAYLTALAPSALAEQALSQPPHTSPDPNHSDSAAGSSSRSVLSLASSAGREKLQAVVNYYLVRFICESGLAPICVDRPVFKTLMQHLNSRYHPVSSTTIADTHIPAEAACVVEKSTAFLRTQTNLTLTLDGGSTRSARSVYTFHVATPERRIFLMRADDTSTQSHTAEHITSLALALMLTIGLERFSAVVTDGASNVKGSRKGIVSKMPTILNLYDPCHCIALLIKDLCTILELKPGIENLRRSLNFFSKSTYATAQLNERRKLNGDERGLDRIGRTRFGTLVIAAASMLRCLPTIRELVSEGVFVVKHTNNLFIPNTPASMQFEMQLTVLVTLLSPLLRAITCLESSFSTPADILLFFSSALSQIETLLLSGSHGLTDDASVTKIRMFCNQRFSQLINESPDDIYVTAFYLDPYHRNSKLLRNINPLTITVTLNSASDFTSHGPTAKMIKRIGVSLFRMLQLEWETHPTGVVRTSYTTAQGAMDALRQQLLLYATSQYPFSEPVGENTSAYNWWKAIESHPNAKLLAFFGVKLFSIVPNSMADERTVSTFTWLNSALRNRQDVATIVRQTQIRQYYGWDEVKHAKAPSRIRFRDVRARKVRESASSNKSQGNHTDSSDVPEDIDQEEFGEDADVWLDEPVEQPPADKADELTMLVGEIIDLNAPELEDCLSDQVPSRLLEKRKGTGVTPEGRVRGNDVPQEVPEWTF